MIFPFLAIAMEPPPSSNPPQVTVNKAPSQQSTSKTTSSLHNAVQDDNEYLVRILLIEGVHVNAVDAEGKTPLDVAAASKFKIIDLLLKNGARSKNFSHLRPIFERHLSQTIEQGVHYVPSNVDILMCAILGLVNPVNLTSEIHHETLKLAIQYAMAQGSATHAASFDFLTRHLRNYHSSHNIINECLSTALNLINKSDPTVSCKKQSYQEFIDSLQTHLDCQLPMADDPQKAVAHDASSYQSPRINHNSSNSPPLVVSTSAKQPAPTTVSSAHQTENSSPTPKTPSLKSDVISESVPLTHFAQGTPLQHPLPTLSETLQPLDQLLLNAAARGLEEEVIHALSSGADKHARCSDGLNALHWAARNGHHKIVEIMVDNPVIINSRTAEESTPLYLATEAGHESIVKLLLDHGAHKTARHRNGNAPIHIAAAKGYTTILTLLLSYGIEVNIRGAGDGTPLHYAAENNHANACTLLLDRGANIDAKTMYDWTPLHFASEKGNTAIVQLLVARGARKDSIEKMNWHTPLHLSAAKGFSDIVKLLLDRLLSKP